MQEQHASVDGRALRVIHEQQQQRAAEEEVQDDDGHTNEPHQIAARTKARLDAVHLAGPHVLGGVVGNAVAQGGEGGDDHVVQLDGGRVACNDAGTKGVDDALQDDVAHRDEALLQDAGDGHHGDLAQHIPGEPHRLALCGDGLHAAEHHHHGQDAAHTLAQEGRPGHTGHTHVEPGHEQDVHADVGQRRDGQEVERRLAVTQRREDAGGNVVEEHERQAQNVDVQIQGRVRQDFLRGVDELQQAAAAQQAEHHQRCTQHCRADEGRVHRGFHVIVFLGTKVARHDDRAANVAAECKGNEDQGDLVAVAHGSQGVFADELACHQAVGNVVQLLEDNAAEHGQAELPQHL